MIAAAILCLTQAVYFEARGEPLTGQLAVAHVVMNRTQSNLYPDDVCKVIKQKNQFSPNIGGTMKDPEAAVKAKVVAEMVYRGVVSDITKGATHFHNGTVKPSWSKRFLKTATIGKHQFYKQRSKT